MNFAVIRVMFSAVNNSIFWIILLEINVLFGFILDEKYEKVQKNVKDENGLIYYFA